MTQNHGTKPPACGPLLDEIEAFLSETRMGVSYFGKRAARNSELVSRLRAGGEVLPSTSARIRNFMVAERQRRKEKAVQK